MATVIDGFFYPPRGMSREEAARYVGVQVDQFDRMVGDAGMPKVIDGRHTWDRVALDTAFSALRSTESQEQLRNVPPPHLPNAYTPKSLAKRWLCSERHVRNLCATGELHSFKAGGKLLRIKREDVEKFERTDNALPKDTALEVAPTLCAVETVQKKRARCLDRPALRAHKPQK